MPIVLADGRAWTLADPGLNRALDPLRDRIFDSCALTETFDRADARAAAHLLLLIGYDLAGVEVARLLDGVDPDALWRAVAEALYGPDAAAPRAAGRPYRTYSRWVRASLRANGLDPEDIPPAELRDVLEILQETGRTVPQSEYVESASAAARRAERSRAHAGALAALAEQGTPAPAPPAPNPDHPEENRP